MSRSGRLVRTPVQGPRPGSGGGRRTASLWLCCPQMSRGRSPALTPFDWRPFSRLSCSIEGAITLPKAFVGNQRTRLSFVTRETIGIGDGLYLFCSAAWA